jgi:septal ring factor EnvC (AmiA/AmiB activator)
MIWTRTLRSIEAPLVKIFAVAATVMMFTVAVVFPQDQELPYVDISSAQEEVARIEAANRERESQNAELQEQIVALHEEIRRARLELVDVRPMLDRVSAQLTELYEVNSTIVDEAMKERSRAVIGRARTIKARLEDRVEMLYDEIAALREQIESHRRRISINNSRIASGQERVIFLEAAVEHTETQRRRLDRFITTVDSILSEAEEYIDLDE